MKEVTHPAQSGVKSNVKTLPSGNRDAHHKENDAPSPYMFDTPVHKTLDSLNNMGDYAPHLKITFLAHSQLRKRSISGSKEYTIVTYAQALDRKIPIDKTNSNIAIVGSERTVDDE